MPTGVYERHPHQGFQKGHPAPKTAFKMGHPKPKNAHIFPKGKNHWNWKEGQFKSTQGYIFILKPEHPHCQKSGYIKRANFVMEKYLGRYLIPPEFVHHKKARADDRIDNLMVFTSKSAHQRFHHNPDNVKSEEIVFDGCQL